MSEYALYKGDTLIAIGTVREIAEQTGLSVHTIRYYGTPSYRKRAPGHHNTILIKLEDD